MVYYSKRNIFLILIFWVLVLVAPAQIIINPGGKDLVLLIVFWFGTSGFYAAVLFGLHYVIRNEEMLIKIGPLSIRRVSIQSITQITPKLNFWAAPAASLHRLHIQYDKINDLMISPRNEENFICELRRINPNITYTPKS